MVRVISGDRRLRECHHKYLRFGQSYSETITNPLGGISTYYYDTNGNLLEVDDPEGGKTSYTYDSNNNITQITFPSGRAISRDLRQQREPAYQNSRSDERPVSDHDVYLDRSESTCQCRFARPVPNSCTNTTDLVI